MRTKVPTPPLEPKHNRCRLNPSFCLLQAMAIVAEAAATSSGRFNRSSIKRS